MKLRKYLIKVDVLMLEVVYVPITQGRTSHVVFHPCFGHTEKSLVEMETGSKAKLTNFFSVRLFMVLNY